MREDIESDFRAGLRLMDEYHPTHIAWGNHDHRLVKLANAPNGHTAIAASLVWSYLQNKADELKAKTVPYHLRKGWFEIGGTAWGHGYMFNETALRDHAEFNGMPTVMAHIHRSFSEAGRTRRGTFSYCVGMAADPEKLEYAHAMRGFSRWSPGLLAGEYSDNEVKAWLIQGPHGGTLQFPPTF